MLATGFSALGVASRARGVGLHMSLRRTGRCSNSFLGHGFNFKLNFMVYRQEVTAVDMRVLCRFKVNLQHPCPVRPLHRAFVSSNISCRQSFETECHDSPPRWGYMRGKYFANARASKLHVVVRPPSGVTFEEDALRSKEDCIIFCLRPR